MTERINRLWVSGNDHGKNHPLDKWDLWVVNRHTELVVQQIEEINNMVLSEDEDMGALYVSAGKAMIFAGSQFLFDTMTGVIYGDGIVYPLGEILHNLEQMKQRSHEWMDQVFVQYTEELKQQIEYGELVDECNTDEEIEDEVEDDSELEENDESEVEEESELDESEWWKDKKEENE